MTGSRTSSPSRSNLDNRNKLGAYRIMIDKGHVYPSELDRHIQDVIRRPRQSPASPNAEKVVAKRRIAAQQNERGGIKQIEPFLLFRGEAEADNRVAGVPLIYSKDEINLARTFLPPAPNANITKTWGELSQPNLTRRLVPLNEVVFSPEEDEVLDGYRLSPYFHFPLLTSQWKTPNSNQNHSHAHNQAGRDGAVIVNHLHEFYSVAYGSEREPSIMETCHFSLTCDLMNGSIFAHWRDQETHHMELVFEFSLRKEAEVQVARRILWNILEYATGERLRSIKAAIPSFAGNRGQFRTVAGSAAALTEASSLDSHAWANFPTPLTPASAASEPVKKRRKRTDSSG
ncbi:hypothetical protein EJ04DRAFT_576544 [Polyplosphaeria fusca]|uniref:DUF7924 domain-containing protein n=1 Tax=Polyplosphaeria fusca TaxID=682080 RepID=A0A9P4R119_9PLEO|nr:hypothetical protein EJ04DRAFT_576544 [Polyplosphaeria fusca]